MRSSSPQLPRPRSLLARRSGAGAEAGDVARSLRDQHPVRRASAVHSASNAGFALDVRYGRYSIDALTSMSARSARRNFNLPWPHGIMLGRQTAKDVDGSTRWVASTTTLADVGSVGASTSSTFSLGLHRVGYGKDSEGDASAMSFAVDMPASISIGTKSAEIGPSSPRLRYGRLAEGDLNESGTRAALAGVGL